MGETDNNSDDSRVSQPEFWEQAYQEQRTGWDLGQAAPSFEDLFADPKSLSPGRLAVIGSGKGHDALLFARHGFEVTGFDFAPSAVEAARRAAAEAGLPATFVQADIFALPPVYHDSFDYVIEHAFFSAIDPARRTEYVTAVSAMLRPGGELIGLFFAHGRPGGPPFGTSAEELRGLVEGRFRVEHLAPATRSVETRQGWELFARFRRI